MAAFRYAEDECDEFKIRRALAEANGEPFRPRPPVQKRERCPHCESFECATVCRFTMKPRVAA